MDRIYGRVRRVVDGDTLDVDVTRRSRENRHDYGEIERIRVAGRNAPERGSVGSELAQQRLARHVAGRSVRIDVRARDRYNRLIGDVTLTPRTR